MLGNRHAFRLRRSRLAPAARQHGNHGDVHIGALDQQFLHEHGRARRHEVLEHRLACALIRIHHLRIRIILVDAHDMAKIAALRCDQLGQSRDDEIALAAIAPRTVQRVAGPAGDLRRQPVLEIACHVAGEKQP